jgi:ferredoxin
VTEVTAVPTRWRIEVDRDSCIGSGMCTGSAPAYFRLVDGKSVPVRDEVDADETVVDAAESCPMEAILVRDATTGDTVAPAD